MPKLRRPLVVVCDGVCQSDGVCVSSRYLEMLLEYLQDYTERVKPLLDQNELYGKVLGEFEKKWENGTFPGWPVSPEVRPC